MVAHAYAASQRATLALWTPPRSPALELARDKHLPQLTAPGDVERYLELLEWRDATARRVDESKHAVCPSAALFEFAKRRPTDLGALARAFDPLPPLVLTDAFGVQASLLATLATLAAS